MGEHVRGWPMVLGLKAQQVSERAGISRDNLRKIEKGEPGPSWGNLAQVLRAPGTPDRVFGSADPLRLRAGNLSKRRAR